jgi:hypothetical protein
MSAIAQQPLHELDTSNDPPKNILSDAEFGRYITELKYDFKKWLPYFEQVMLAQPTDPERPDTRSVTINGVNGTFANYSYNDLKDVFLSLLSRAGATNGFFIDRDTKKARRQINKEYIKAKNDIYNSATSVEQLDQQIDQLDRQYREYSLRLKGQRTKSAVGGPVYIPEGTLLLFIQRLLRFYLLTAGVVNDQPSANGSYVLLDDNTLPGYISRHFEQLNKGYLKSVTLQHLLRYVLDYNMYSGVLSVPGGGIRDTIFQTLQDTGIKPKEAITSNTVLNLPVGVITNEEAPRIGELFNRAGINVNEFNPTAVASKLIKAAIPVPANESAEQAKARRKAESDRLDSYNDILDAEYGRLRALTKSSSSVININRFMYKKAREFVRAAQESLVNSLIENSLVSNGRLSSAQASQRVAMFNEAIKKMHTNKYPKQFGVKMNTDEKKRQLALLRQQGAQEYSNITAQLQIDLNYAGGPLTFEVLLSLAPENEVLNRITNPVNERLIKTLADVRKKSEKNALLSEKLND